MTREEFATLVKAMKAMYPQPQFIPDKYAFELWYGLLNDLSYSVGNMAVRQYMNTNKFPPTVADIRELATKIVNGSEPDWGEGWAQVQKAIHMYGMYNPDGAMEYMNEVTRDVVKRLGFQNLCTSDNEAADRARFREIYNGLSEEKKKRSVIPEALRREIDAVREQIEERRCGIGANTYLERHDK